MVVISCGTWETGDEIPITYSIKQRKLYDLKRSECIYEQFERQVGANKGNFVEMVAKKHFEDLGYYVESFFYIVRNRIERESMPGFKTICTILGEDKVQLLISEADAKFKANGKSRSAGDPDLFVYNLQSHEHFFVEVKETDRITPNQRILFPLLQEQLCSVYIARVSVEA